MIHRQILVVKDKKRRKGGGRERSEKDTTAFFLPGRRAYPPSLFLHPSSFQPRYLVKILSVTYIVAFSIEIPSALAVVRLLEGGK
ncbi:hypothetical protein [Aneurinibacillus migulanus]|uniref:hypothetical protein n=1 Tax=Aneurinibacillus migulanus TaxID=47500 RepID=UPI001F3247CF|nr:hypothetical protein [Aneurinibacillus migulanus]